MIGFGKENNNIGTPPFLISITDVNADIFKNMLKIVIAMPKYGEPGEGVNTEEGKEFQNAVPIYADNNEIYEIVFEDYIAYRSTNDHYSGKEENTFIGRYLKIYSDSDFLKYILGDTIADGYVRLGNIDTPVHYGICTESHIIDVVSHVRPKIKRI